MIRKQTSLIWRAFVPVILAICILAGCAVKKGNLWGDPETGLILQYRMTENQGLKYQTSVEQTQNIEVMGQSMDTETNSTIAFSVKSKGLKENNHQLGITIDSMSINIASPQGELSPDMSSVMGKSFDMTLSPLGKELEISGADSLQYDMGQTGNRSVESDFQAMFPDLADSPVKIGDTWESKDTIIEKTGMIEVRLNLKSLNTLEGFEAENGLECVKITSAVTGTLEGEGEQMGMGLTFTGEIEGTDTWYFAYKEGLFVKMITDAFIEGAITTSGAQSMTIPLKQDKKIETKLIR